MSGFDNKHKNTGGSVMPRNHHSREVIISFYLDEKGYPRWPKRVFKLSKDDLLKVDFVKALKTQNVIGLTCLLNGKWEILGGTVEKIDFFSDGNLVFLVPRTGSFCSAFPIILIWMPDSDNKKSGMLY